MTDKIIVDNIDVSGCEFYPYVDDDCREYGKCENNPNCYYKQLKRKEKECEKWKMQYNCNACGTCNGKEDYKNLARHCENALRQLQAEKEKVRELEDILQDPEVRVALTDVRTGERELWYKLGSKSNKYKQALELIKNICDEIDGIYPLSNDILTIIDEVLND